MDSPGSENHTSATMELNNGVDIRKRKVPLKVALTPKEMLEDDEEEEEDEEEKKIRKAIRKKTYYGGPIGVFLWCIAPPLILIPVLRCLGSDEKFSKWPGYPTTLVEYLDPLMICVIPAIVIGEILISKVKFGPVVQGELVNGKRIRHRLNGQVIIGLGIFFLAFFISINFLLDFPLDLLYDKLVSIIVMHYIACLIMASIAYYHVRWAEKEDLNIHGNTGNFIYDFCMGREVNPHVAFLGNLDAKKAFYRHMYLFWGALDVSILGKQAAVYGYANPTLLLAGLGHACHILEYFVFEENYITTLTGKFDGVGLLYMLNCCIVTPVMSSFNYMYVLAYHYQMEGEGLAILAFFVIGGTEILYRFTNADKLLFTRYPDHQDVINYKYLPARDDKRILVDGWWGIVRHPNYTADIICAFAWCSATGFSSIVPFTYGIFLTLLLIHRIRRNEDLCRYEFGKAYEEYCQHVKYKLIPYIY